MHRLCFTVSVSIAALVLPSPPARAQEPDTVSAAQRAGAALARLVAGQHVRVYSGGVGRVEGSVVTSSSTLVTLRTDGSRIDVSAPGVDSLWVRAGTHAGTGALIGAAVGGLALGAVGAWATHDLCKGPGNCNEAAGFLVGFVIGGTGGGGIGALIGAAFPKWQLRVP